MQKAYVPRRKVTIFDVCECGHTISEHEFPWDGPPQPCRECMCPKFKFDEDRKDKNDAS
jgi:hypothetical protein